jgi:hypothetical protein
MSQYLLKEPNVDGDFSLTCGDSINLKVIFDDGATPPNPIDISGRTLRFTIKFDYNDPDTAAIVQASVTFPADTDSRSGIGWFYASPDDTKRLPIGDEVWCDFQESYTDARGKKIVNTLAVFKKRVGIDVTKDY